jgi:ribosomal protein S18 acetylase RimI-like enzyme
MAVDAAPVSIRRYRPSDYPRLLELWEAGGINPFSPEAVEALLQAGGILVAEFEGEVAGVACWSHNGRQAILWRMAVDPSRRREGIGTALLEACEWAAAEAGFVKLGLLVKVDNPEAKAFYEAHGWARREDLEWWEKPARPCPPEQG